KHSTPPTRTRCIRETHPGVYDREATYQIPDEGFINSDVGAGVLARVIRSIGSCYTLPSFFAICRELLFMSEPYTPTARTRVTREPHRGVYDREAAYQILDEGFICHVSFLVDNPPFVLPTSYD